MDKPYVIGIDIGGTNSVFGVVDTRGNVLYNGSIKTGKYEDVNDYVRALGEGLQAVIRSAGGRDKIKGIGVGAPNGNYFNGCIEFAANLPWKGKVPLAQLISDRTGGIPVTLTNDANAAAIGEMTYGAARGLKDFIVITLGTGVGSGIVCGGNLVYGHDGFAGELGHTTVRRENGRLCGCGRHGCGPYGTRVADDAHGRESAASAGTGQNHLEGRLRRGRAGRQAIDRDLRHHG